mmetsp:Transcript_387/g.458  ORF Transcript_387/g.458 Transcript_387/m.458 type:complete len:152 (-) Transcript_387:65-520(-)|eukprot:CAMPEP_0184006608 /NCGR_PEP_ID=MMETSP0954-20121128/799_1 /TAXON_ID=627963 /ORGANISM="Aplanochytrium sp, Strain PBS07" /LENGTH=151 /DNA_ID=CAMNT_0026285199 /DNA_START=191 /DNA_END=646 /DNA_ORIENTATION=+
MEKRTEADIKRLVELLSTDEFIRYISEKIENPFRATSNVRIVELLDGVFMENPPKPLRLHHFQIEGEPDALDQLPNLLKTYVLKTDYDFGTDAEVDRKFTYIIYRILHGHGNSFNSFKSFSLAFSKVRPLRRLYEDMEKYFQQKNAKKSKR